MLPPNWSAPADGTTNEPAVSLPPPARSRVPLLALTVPVLLNSVLENRVVLPMPAALVKVPPLANVPEEPPPSSMNWVVGAVPGLLVVKVPLLRNSAPSLSSRTNELASQVTLP